MAASDRWLARLNGHRCLPLATYPTPLEHLPRLSQELGRDIFLKRDDGMGPGMGGNKTRKLEFLLADALALGASRVATFGGLQSNHARITAAAARRCGLEPHLFYFQRRPARLTGNLLLNHVAGARMHFLPLGGAGGGMTLETTIRLVRILARLRIGSHYFIPVGGHSWLGCLGYVRAALEIDAQVREMGLTEARLVMAAGTGGTLAGLLVGLTLLESAVKPLGIDVGSLWKGFTGSVARLSSQISSRLGAEVRFTAAQVPLIERTYVGSGYGIASPAGLAAIRRLAATEGVLLDPIYTGKAFGALLDLNRRGALGGDEPVIFLHTGGMPALFAGEWDGDARGNHGSAS